MIKIFAKEQWPATLQGLRRHYRVFVPVREGDFHHFDPLDEGKGPSFDYRNSRLSPKFIVFPQSERMFEYSVDHHDLKANIMREATKDYCPQAIVGIRPCDAQAFQIAKVNFDNPQYRDPWWVQRFESTVLIGLGCNEPDTTCFCTSVGGGPFSPKGLDGLLYDLGNEYLAKAFTQKGRNFLERAEEGYPARDDGMGTGSLQEEAERLAQASFRKISTRVETDKLKEKVVNELFNASFWEETAFACISCGICTFLCPTCWCFDIQDEASGNEGDRIRNWDSCMFPLFTLHGSGRNPRGEKFRRVRQRFMHKLKYYVDKYGDGVQCSGCGRCVKHCPVNIDIREVCELMNNYG